MKIIILFTPNNIASKNIAEKLMEEHSFQKVSEAEWKNKIMNIKLVDTKAPDVLSVPVDFDVDGIIVLSTHKSKRSEKTMTIHLAGNWGKAELGGNEGTLNIAACSIMKKLAQEIKKEAEQIGYNFTLEVDHHGPTGNVAIIFVEIGTEQEQWKDQNASRAMARALMKALVRSEKYRAFFGVGGGHYPKTFTKIELEDPVWAVGHILPKYAIDSVDESMLLQAIEKSSEKTEKVVVLKEETNAKQQEKIKKIAEKNSILFELI